MTAVPTKPTTGDEAFPFTPSTPWIFCTQFDLFSLEVFEGFFPSVEFFFVRPFFAIYDMCVELIFHLPSAARFTMGWDGTGCIIVFLFFFLFVVHF